ncbi:MFS transporter [Phytohabitans flavus]|uniref:MFS transporter n=1 Tax=Phytohabitans flavus TaxID=1076124 RepID=UPI001565D326|nr:MFS transporter [Phytohabitans flavus]
MTAANSTVQTAAEDHVRGRVIGLYMLVFLGGGAIGGPIIGAVAEYFGPRAGMLVAGVAAGLVTLVVAVQLGRAVGFRFRLRRVRRPAAAVVVAAATRQPQPTGIVSDSGNPGKARLPARYPIRCRIAAVPAALPTGVTQARGRQLHHPPAAILRRGRADRHD